MKFYSSFATKIQSISQSGYYYSDQKNRYSQDIDEVDLQFDHVISYDIDFGWTSTWPAGSACRELALQIKVNIAWYHMIEQCTYLMNISAVKFFFGQAVLI